MGFSLDFLTPATCEVFQLLEFVQSATSPWPWKFSTEALEACFPNLTQPCPSCWKCRNWILWMGGRAYSNSSCVHQLTPLFQQVKITQSKLQLQIVLTQNWRLAGGVSWLAGRPAIHRLTGLVGQLAGSLAGW